MVFRALFVFVEFQPEWLAEGRGKRAMQAGRLPLEAEAS